MKDLDIVDEEILIVSSEEEGKRLDIYLSSIFEEHSRSYIKKLIDNGNVLVNDKKLKSGFKLSENDVIKISFPSVQEFSLKPQNLPLHIVYEDSDIAVINKPKGMVVHPAVGNLDNTLVNALLFHIKDLSGINGELRPGIVHRIDKDTTGLLVVAKNDLAHRSLSEQIKNKTCKREYLALVHNVPQFPEGKIETFIGRSFKDRKQMAVVRENEGRTAITHYKLIKKFGPYSMIQFNLETGRTHQIRVHCKHLNIPIVGDQIYCSIKNNLGATTQMLHAFRLTLTHPRTNEIMQFNADLPQEFQDVLNKLERQTN